MVSYQVSTTRSKVYYASINQFKLIRCKIILSLDVEILTLHLNHSTDLFDLYFFPNTSGKG